MMPAPRPTHAFVAALLLGNSAHVADSLVHPSHLPQYRRQLQRTTARHYAPKHSPLEDEPWQKDQSYWDELQAASARGPEAFEKFIEESMERKGAGTLPTEAKTGANGMEGEGKPKKKGKYQPIEEWEEQRQNGENMSAEERLQWECQRSGNQFRQNEILQHHLNSF